jgi:hypothetical protein
MKKYTMFLSYMLYLQTFSYFVGVDESKYNFGLERSQLGKPQTKYKD